MTNTHLTLKFVIRLINKNIIHVLQSENVIDQLQHVTEQQQLLQHVISTSTTFSDKKGAISLITKSVKNQFIQMTMFRFAIS